MSQVKKTQVSFAGGEIAPECQGRLDLDKYQIGLATCENFLVTPHGPIKNRAGFAHVNRAKYDDKKHRLIPFSYNAEQFAQIEMGDLYARFHIDGQTMLETALNLTGVTAANPAVVTYAGADPASFANDQWVYIDDVVGTMSTLLNGRFFKVAAVNTGANTFALKDLNGVDIDTTGLTYTSGGTFARVYEIATPYTEDEVDNIDYSQNGDIISLTHIGHYPYELARMSATEWVIGETDFDTEVTPPTTVTAVVGAGAGTKTYQYAVSCLAADGLSESPVQRAATGATKNLTGVSKAYVIVAYVRFPTGTTIPLYGWVGVFDMASTAGLVKGQTIGPVTGVVGVQNVNNQSFKVWRVVSATRIYVYYSNNKGCEKFTGTWTSGGQFYDQPLSNDLTVAGNFNTISWAAVDGAHRYRVYKLDLASKMFGFIGETEGLTFDDDNIVPDLSTTPPENNNPFTGAGNTPAACCHFEQRRFFAGTPNGPQYVWATNTARESSMTASFPPRANDAFSMRIASRQNNMVRHLVPVQDLLAFTYGAVYRIASSAGAISASDVSQRLQTYTGSTDVQPIATGSAVVFVSSENNHISALAFQWDQQSFEAEDLAIIAVHLLDGFTITSMAFQRGSIPTVWATRDDGVLLGLTYMPSQRVIAWHQHNTDGLIERVSVVSENGVDRVYVSTKRTIEGVDRRFIERMAMRESKVSADCFYVDCGISYSGTATSVVTNAWHLEGCDVAVLADGEYLGLHTVTNGTVDLGTETYTKIHLGLPYRSLAKTLPLATSQTGIGDTVNVNGVWALVDSSRGIQAGVSADDLFEPASFRVGPYDGVPPLITEAVEIPLSGDWNTNGQVVVVQDYPLPCTVSALVLDVARN